MTSKQRAYLKSLAMKMEPIIQIGKSSLTPELTKAVEEASRTVWMIPEAWRICWRKEPALRWYRLLERKSSFTEKAKKIRKKYFFPNAREFKEKVSAVCRGT